MKKTPYRIRNWPAYNAALIGRGSLTLWVDEAAIRSWRYTGPTQRGAQYHYTDAAIGCVLTLRAVYHLALRAGEGLARSVFALLAVALPVPSYSTLSRRAATGCCSWARATPPPATRTPSAPAPRRPAAPDDRPPATSTRSRWRHRCSGTALHAGSGRYSANCGSRLHR